MSETVHPPSELCRCSEVAELFDIHVNTVYAWVRNGLLPAVKVGRVCRIPRSAIDELLEAAK